MSVTINTEGLEVVYKKPSTLTDLPLHYCPGCGHGIVHRLLAESNSALVAASLEDALGVRRRPNLPGTTVERALTTSAKVYGAQVAAVERYALTSQGLSRRRARLC